MALKKKKLFIQIFCSVFAAWIFFLALMPTLLSKGGLKYLINKKFEGSFSYEKASLSWFRPQRIEGLHYQSSKLGLKLQVDSFQSTASLWNLLLNSKNLKVTHIKGLNAQIESLQEKERSLLVALEERKALAHTLESNDTPPYFIFAFPFIGKFHIDQSKVTLLSKEYEPIVFDKIQLNCNMVSKVGPLLGNLACETSQKELSGSAFLNLELGGFDKESKIIFTPFDRDILFLSPKAYVQLNAELTNLPTLGLDHLALLYHPRFDGVLSSLFGDALNFGSQINMVKGKSTLNLMANAPNMDLKFSGSIVQNELFLDEASVCNFKITPKFMHALSKACELSSPLSIAKESQASIHLDRLSIPLEFKNFNLSMLSCNAQFELGEMQFSKESVFQDLKINQIKAALDTFDIGESATFHLKVAAEDASHPMLVQADGQVSKLFHIQDHLDLNELQGTCQLELKEVPSRFLTHLTSQKLFFNEILGPTTSLNLTFKGSPVDGSLVLGVSSSRLQLQEAIFKLKNSAELNLIQATPLNYRLNPSFAKLILNPKFTLLHPFEIQGKFKKLALSFKNEEKKVLDLNLKLSSKPFETSFDNSKPIHIRDTQVYVSKNEEEKLEAKAYFTAVLPEDYESTPIGNLFNFSLLFKDIPVLSKEAHPELVGLIKGKKMTTEFEGILDQDFNLKLTEKLKAELQVLETHFSPLSFYSKSPLRIEIEPCTFSLLNLDLNQLQLEGKIQSDKILIKKANREFLLTDVSAPFTYLGCDKTLGFQLEALGEKLTCSGEFTSFDLKSMQKTAFKLKGKLDHLPSQALAFILNKDLPYPDLVGPSFGSHFKIRGAFNPELATRVSYLFKSDLLQSEGAFSIEKDFFLNQPLTFDFLLTQENSEALQKLAHLSVDLDLIEPADLHLQLNRLHKSKGSSFPEAIEGEIHLDELQTQKGDFRHLEGHFETPNLEKGLKAQLHVHTLGESKPGELLIKGEWEEPFAPHLTGQLSCSATDLSKELIESLVAPFSSTLSSLSTVLSSSNTLSISTKLKEGKGPIKLDLNSDHLTTSCLLEVTPDQITLGEDFVATLKCTPTLCRTWLHKINPLLISAVSCQAPLTLSIPKEGFSMQVAPFKLSQLQIPSGQLDLGQVTLKEEGHLGQIYALFSKKAESNEFSSWFTPCRFSIQDGVLTLNSNHLQFAQEFHLALWGKWDLIQNSNTFYLGLPTKTLQSAFGLSKLPTEYVFQIPLEEKEGVVQADWKLARKQLSILSSAASPFLSSQEKREEASLQLEQIKEVVAKSELPKNLTATSESFPWDSSEEVETPTLPSSQPKQEDTSQILHQLIREVKKKLGW